MSHDINAIVGSWKFESVENGDAYYKKCGIGMVLRQVAKAQKPNVRFECNGDQWHAYIDSAFKNHDWLFKLNERTKLTTIDGRTFWTTYTDEDGALVETQETLAGEKNAPSVVRRWVEGGKLLVSEACEGVVCKRSFTRLA